MVHRTEPAENAEVTERFRIVGTVGAAVFPGWITRHAGRLGLRSSVVSQDAGVLEVLVAGRAALVDAMALGCSLGPQEVLVDEVLRERRNHGDTQESPTTNA